MQFFFQSEFSQPEWEKSTNRLTAEQVSEPLLLGSYLNLACQGLLPCRLLLKEARADGIFWGPLTSITPILHLTITLLPFRIGRVHT